MNAIVDTPDPRPVSLHLATGALAAIVKQAEKIMRWDRRFQAALPLELKARCRVINVRSQILVVHADNAAWAMRVRYLTYDLMQQLNECLDAGDEKILGITCRVRV